MDEIVSNRLLTRPVRSLKKSKHGRVLTLAENIEAQQKRRLASSGRYPSVSGIGRLTAEIAGQECTPSLQNALLDYLRTVEMWRTGKGSNIGPSRRMFAETLAELESHEQSRLIQGFWKLEPGWKLKFERWKRWRTEHIL